VRLHCNNEGRKEEKNQMKGNEMKGIKGDREGTC
jgi:hypothetical protein